MSSNLTEEAKKLSIAERIDLVEEIWDSIVEENGCFELSEAQKEELDRRSNRFAPTPHRAERGKRLSLNSSAPNSPHANSFSAGGRD